MPDNQGTIIGGVWYPSDIWSVPAEVPIAPLDPQPEAVAEPIDMSKVTTTELADVNQALRYNKGKPQLSYTPLALMEAVSHVMEFGASKYERDNWKKGFPYLSLVDSLQRHLMAWSEGEDVDPESGLNHMWHVACNVGFICHQLKHGIGTDNRPKGPQG